MSLACIDSQTELTVSYLWRNTGETPNKRALQEARDLWGGCHEKFYPFFGRAARISWQIAASIFQREIFKIGPSNALLIDGGPKDVRVKEVCVVGIRHESKQAQADITIMDNGDLDSLSEQFDGFEVRSLSPLCLGSPVDRDETDARSFHTSYELNTLW